jgi:hypothetical protein
MGRDKSLEIGTQTSRLRFGTQTIYFAFGDFEAAATSDTLDGTAIPHCIPLGGSVTISNLFGAPAATAASLTAGDSGDADGIITALNVWDGEGGDGDGDGDTGDVVSDGADVAGAYHATYTPRITLSLTDDNCADLTQGSGRYDFHYMQVVVDNEQS